LLARIGLCAGCATLGVRAIRSAFLLRGPCAPKVLAWSCDGQWSVELADGAARPATLQAGSFRMGQAGAFLWLRTRDQRHGIFIDAGGQQPGPLQGLFRRLEVISRGHVDEPGLPS